MSKSILRTLLPLTVLFAAACGGPNPSEVVDQIAAAGSAGDADAVERHIDIEGIATQFMYAGFSANGDATPAQQQMVQGVAADFTTSVRQSVQAGELILGPHSRSLLEAMDLDVLSVRMRAGSVSENDDGSYSLDVEATGLLDTPFTFAVRVVDADGTWKITRVENMAEFIEREAAE